MVKQELQLKAILAPLFHWAQCNTEQLQTMFKFPPEHWEDCMIDDKSKSILAGYVALTTTLEALAALEAIRVDNDVYRLSGVKPIRDEPQGEKRKIIVSVDEAKKHNKRQKLSKEAKRTQNPGIPPRRQRTNFSQEQRPPPKMDRYVTPPGEGRPTNHTRGGRPNRPTRGR